VLTDRVCRVSGRGKDDRVSLQLLRLPILQRSLAGIVQVVGELIFGCALGEPQVLLVLGVLGVLGRAYFGSWPDFIAETEAQERA
jgi:hypothetical protein